MKRIIETKTFYNVRDALAYLHKMREQGKETYYCGYVKNGRVIYDVEIYGRA